jgi:HSP20 family molecular chaperone IbpA
MDAREAKMEEIQKNLFELTVALKNKTQPTNINAKLKINYYEN